MKNQEAEEACSISSSRYSSIVLELLVKSKRSKESTLTATKEELVAHKERQEALEAKIEEVAQTQALLSQSQDVLLVNQARLETRHENISLYIKTIIQVLTKKT